MLSYEIMYHTARIYLHSKPDVWRHQCSVSITIKTETLQNFRSAALLLFYFLQSFMLREVAYFSGASCNTAFQETKLTFENVVPATQVPATTALLLLLLFVTLIHGLYN